MTVRSRLAARAALATRALVATTLVAGACGREESRSDTAAPPAAGASARADTVPWTAGIVDRPRPAVGVATLVAVRAARREGFDRVVFEFAGPELPGVHVEYVDRPVRDCGAGNVVPLAGDGWLAVRFEPARAHDDDGAPTAGPRELRPGLPVVLEAERTCDFEAIVEVVLGVSSPNRYRVLELADPARLVVDVRHEPPSGP